MPRVLLALAVLALTIYAVIDAIQTEDARVQHLPKVFWILLILIFTPIGAIAWLIAGRDRQQNGRPRSKRPSAPRGPDDDPDFLRNL